MTVQSESARILKDPCAFHLGLFDPDYDWTVRIETEIFRYLRGFGITKKSTDFRSQINKIFFFCHSNVVCVKREREERLKGMAASLSYFSVSSLPATEKPLIPSISITDNRRRTSCVCFSNSRSNKHKHHERVTLSSRWKSPCITRATKV